MLRRCVPQSLRHFRNGKAIVPWKALTGAFPLTPFPSYRSWSSLARYAPLLQQGSRHARTFFTLTEEQENIRSVEKAIFYDLLQLLTEANASESEGKTVKKALQHLDEFCLLSFAGEFNSGKSTLINSLLDADVVDTGVVPTTAAITLIKKRKSEMADGLEVQDSDVKPIRSSLEEGIEVCIAFPLVLESA